MIKIVLIVCLSQPVIAAFEYRTSPPAALFPFSQAVNEDSLPDSISNPAYLPRIQFLYLNCAGSKPYTLDGLYSTTLRAGYAGRGFAVQALWDRYGIDQYCENVVEVNCAYMPVRYVSLGTGVSYYNLNINTMEVSMTTHLADCKASILVTPIRWFEMAFQFNNFASLFIKKRRDLIFPGWLAGAALKPFKGFALLYNINKTPNGYINTIAASANVLKFFSIRVGYAKEAMTYSGALAFIYKFIAISYGLKYHPHLGFTHTAGLTLTASVMNIDSLSYGSLFSRSNEQSESSMININSCSMDQLQSIPGIRQNIASRIMKHRETIGPLSRNSLLQIGLSDHDIEQLLTHVTGLVPDDATSRKNDTKAALHYEKARKDLFKQLVDLGIPAATALDLAEMALSGHGKRCSARIESMADLTAGKKKQALDLCGASR